MTEDIGNILERSTPPHHLRRGTVSENVRTEPLRLETGLFQSASRDPGTVDIGVPNTRPE